MIDFQKLYEDILSYPLNDIIAKDTTLKPCGSNQFIGKSPFRKENKPSFSVGLKNGSWFYFDHATQEGGNVFTYLKQKHNLDKNIEIANFLKLAIPTIDGTIAEVKYTAKKIASNPIDWEAEAHKKHQNINNNLRLLTAKITVEIKKLNNNLSITDFNQKKEWNYPEKVTELIGKKLSNKKHLRNKVEIIPQKYRDEDGTKKWRYVEKIYYPGYAKSNYLYSKAEVKEKYSLTNFVDIYNKENIANLDYIIFTEGESDCDAAFASGLNAGALPSPNLDNQKQLISALLQQNNNIKFAFIFADNDWTGIKKALTTLQACNEIGLAAIAVNTHTQKLILKSKPEESLREARKESQKWFNDNQGYDLRDFIKDCKNDVFVTVQSLIKEKISEFVYGDNKFRKTYAQDGLKDNDLNFYRLSLFFQNKKDFNQILTPFPEINFYLEGKDLTTKENCKTIFGVRKYLEKTGKDVTFFLNGRTISFQKLMPIAEEVQRIFNYYHFSSQIELRTQYLSGDILEQALSQLNLKNKLIAIKSGLGTNKTGSIGQLINSHKELRDRGTLQLSDINKLLIQTVERYNKLTKTFYHLHQDSAHELIAEEQSNIACCIQSLLNFKKQEVKGKNIIIDENMSVIFSLLDGGTFPNSVIQQLIKQQLEMVLQEAYCVFILDGNLSNKNVDMMAEMAKKESIKIENFNPIKHRYTFKMINDWAACIAQAVDDYKIGKRIAICADSQTELRRIYKLFTEKYGFAKESIVIGDKKSTEEECPLELQKNPSQFFLDHPEIKVFLYSPSMGRGFDIQGKVFDVLYSYFCGVLSVDQIDQMPFRLRDYELERIIWISNEVNFTQKVNKYTDNKKIELANQFLDSLKLLNLEKLKDDVVNLVKKYASDSLFNYGEELDNFNIESAKNLEFSFQCFGLLKGYDMLTTTNKHENTKEIAQLKEVMKEEEKRAEEIFFQETVTNIQNLDTIKQDIAEYKNDIQEIEEKCATTDLFLSEERKQQLTEEKQEIEKSLQQKTTAYLKAKKQLDKIERRFPTVTESKYFNNQSIIECLVDNAISKDLEIELTRYYYLSQDMLPTKIMEKQLFLYIKSQRLAGNAWVNDFDTEALLIDKLRAMNIFNLIQKYSYGSATLHQNCEDLLSISDNWDSTLFGERPKNLLKQLSKVLGMVGFDTINFARDKDSGANLYAIIPWTFKCANKGLKGKQIKEKLEAEYSFYKEFTEKLVESTGIRIANKYQYKTSWNTLPEPVECEEKTEQDFSIYYNKIESPVLINSQPAELDRAIELTVIGCMGEPESETVQVDGTWWERLKFKGGTIIEIAETVAQAFWAEAFKPNLSKYCLDDF